MEDASSKLIPFWSGELSWNRFRRIESASVGGPGGTFAAATARGTATSHRCTQEAACALSAPRILTPQRPPPAPKRLAKGISDRLGSFRCTVFTIENVTMTLSGFLMQTFYPPVQSGPDIFFCTNSYVTSRPKHRHFQLIRRSSLRR